jgi:AAA domain
MIRIAMTSTPVRGKDSRVIIWVNGTFGAGKTTTGSQLAGRLANARHFDPEQVGYLLMRTLEDHEFRDFQDLAPWRELVPVFTEKIARFTGQHLIAVQTVLREDYWRELAVGFERTPLDIFHVLLHVDSDVLAERIKADEVEAGACQWRLDHISDYEKARPWMESAADLVIDTTHLPAAEVAERIAVKAERRMAEAPSLCGGISIRPGCSGRMHVSVVMRAVFIKNQRQARAHGADEGRSDEFGSV